MSESDLLTRVAELMPQAREELSEIVAIRSVADPRQFSPEECLRAATWVADRFAGVGFDDIRLEETADGSSAVVGSRACGDCDAPTVLLYAHYDVQPPLNLDAWRTPPFRLTEVDGRWYGRGAADCKGNLLMHLTALRALGDELPVHLKLVIEGSEEQGTGGLEAFVPDHADLPAPTPSSSGARNRSAATDGRRSPPAGAGSRRRSPARRRSAGRGSARRTARRTRRRGRVEKTARACGRSATIWSFSQRKGRGKRRQGSEGRAARSCASRSGARPSSSATMARASPSPTARPVRPAATRSSPEIDELAVADVVEPAPGALVARGGQQLDGLDALAAQKAPHVGVAAVQVTVKALEAARRGHDHVAVLPLEAEVVQAGGERLRGDRRAARREREQPGPARSASQSTREALAEQRRAQPVAVQQLKRPRRLAQQQPQLVAGAVAASRSPAARGRSAPRCAGRRELQPRGVAHEPQHPRRVVGERALVQDAQDAVARGPRGRPARR